MSMALDVHVLTMANTRAAWSAQRRISMAQAAAEAGYEVNIREIPGVLGHIGAGRAAGYAMGEAPYVTYVDDDDYVTEDAFAALLPGMLAGADAVCPGEFLDRNGQLSPALHRHHLIAYRREIAEQFPMRDWAACGDIALQASLEGDVVDIPHCVYVHRVYMSPGRKLRWASREMGRVNG